MKNVDVVTSYYNDFYKFDWKNLIDHKKYNLILYKKDNSILIDSFVVDREEIIIPNFGRCEYAFFHHIVNNYDNLSDVTIFTKINWKDQGINFSELLDECVNYDFYEVGTCPESSLWYDENHLEYLSIETKYHKCPINLDKPYDNMGNCHDLTNRSLPIQTYADWYNHIFPRDLFDLPKEVVCYGHGPCFSVSKNLIHRHPLETYKYMLERFHPRSGAWDSKSTQMFDHPGLGKITASQYAPQMFHDTCQRFCRILFTHATDKSSYKIKLNH